MHPFVIDFPAIPAGRKGARIFRCPVDVIVDLRTE